MKKLLSLVAIFTLVFSISGCGGSKSDLSKSLAFECVADKNMDEDPIVATYCTINNGLDQYVINMPVVVTYTINGEDTGVGTFTYASANPKSEGLFNAILRKEELQSQADELGVNLDDVDGIMAKILDLEAVNEQIATDFKDSTYQNSINPQDYVAKEVPEDELFTNGLKTEVTLENTEVSGEGINTQISITNNNDFPVQYFYLDPIAVGKNEGGDLKQVYMLEELHQSVEGGTIHEDMYIVIEPDKTATFNGKLSYDLHFEGDTDDVVDYLPVYSYVEEK